MTDIITKIRAFTIWNDEAELKWLEEMATQGYFLIAVRAGFFYTFECAAPKPVRYCHGFRRVRPADKANFLQLYADAGWQHAATHVGWQHYFWSDAESPNVMDKETAYRDTARTLKRMAIFFLVVTVILGFILMSLVMSEAPPELITTYLFVTGLYLLMVFWIYSGRKRQLTKLEKMQRNDQE